ncbi:MAG: non-canonical purine NTP diphosphatase [Bacteroidota bacterium]
MTQKLVFATHNNNKLKEVKQMLPQEFEVVSLNDINCHEEIIEDGTTIKENAEIKANFVFENYGLACFADDTGLEVEALNGEPGVYSARYAGNEKDSIANNRKLLDKLKLETNRKAQFKTVICLKTANETHYFTGICKGKIIENLRGEEGFGYDPIFIPAGYDQTFAEMQPAEKNKISHRGLAFQQLIHFLKKE